ncbi:8931_t:CDS:2 [Ambispora gerdemannii]|uniref:8931_t:CDS:1 n=1 Tax=Ambispora gerdemannii TaxID=144530 RepID=A0A9N8V5G9_9GLOM|nr:8931_t:CDS:2 [Ambispora gerdemannii]
MATKKRIEDARFFILNETVAFVLPASDSKFCINTKNNYLIQNTDASSERHLKNYKNHRRLSGLLCLEILKVLINIKDFIIRPARPSSSIKLNKMENTNLIERNNVQSEFTRGIPKFPPQITANDLIEKAILKLKTSGQTSRTPNAFIAYRMAICKELRLSNDQVLSQTQLSTLVKESWVNEPEHVRHAYQEISAEARDLYKQIIQKYEPKYKPEYEPEFKSKYEPEFKPNHEPEFKPKYEPEFKPKNNNLFLFDSNVATDTFGDIEVSDSQSSSPAAEIELIPNQLTNSLMGSDDSYDFSQNSSQKESNARKHEQCDCCKEKITKLENKVNDLEEKVSFLIGELVGLKLTQNQYAHKM